MVRLEGGELFARKKMLFPSVILHIKLVGVHTQWVGGRQNDNNAINTISATYSQSQHHHNKHHQPVLGTYTCGGEGGESGGGGGGGGGDGCAGLGARTFVCLYTRVHGKKFLRHVCPIFSF